MDRKGACADPAFGMDFLVESEMPVYGGTQGGSGDLDDPALKWNLRNPHPRWIYVF